MGNNCCKDASGYENSQEAIGRSMRPSEMEQHDNMASGNYLAIPNNKSALKSGISKPKNVKMNLKHMNSIGSTTRAKLNEYQNSSYTPSNRPNKKRYQFRKTRTLKEGKQRKKFNKQASLISQNSDMPNIMFTPAKGSRVHVHHSRNNSGQLYGIEEGSAVNMTSSQGNFSHAYTNMMKDNFKCEDFDSQISLSNMSHNTLRSSLFPDTTFKNTYKNVWSNNSLPYYLFETRIMPNAALQTQNSLHKNPFKRGNSKTPTPIPQPEFPPQFPRNLPTNLLPKNLELTPINIPVTIPHPDYKFNNSVFRGYIRKGKKHGFCAFRLSLGEIVILYFYHNMPIAYEATFFYQNSETCSIINEYGYRSDTSNSSKDRLSSQGYYVEDQMKKDFENDRNHITSAEAAWGFNKNLNNFGILQDRKYLDREWFMNEIFRGNNGVYRWPQQQGMFKGKIKNGKPHGPGKN